MPPPASWPVLAPEPTVPITEPVATPTFSVIIAAYQAERTLGDAIRSVLTQTSPPLEIVVCDDGSTDATADVARSFGAQVRLVQRPNGGESAAKNTAAAAASGEFVVVLDADDVFLPRRLEAMGWLARRRPDLDVLLTDAHLVADGRVAGTAYRDGWPFECADQPAEILRRNFILGLAGVRRTRWDDVGGFDESVSLTADWDFFIRLLRSGSAAGLVDVPLAEYRLRPDTLSSDRIRLAESRITTIERARDRGGLHPPELAGLHDALAGQYRELLVRRATAALTERSGEARRHLLSIARDPRFRVRRRAVALAAAAAPAVASAGIRATTRGTVEIGAGLRVPGPTDGIGSRTRSAVRRLPPIDRALLRWRWASLSRTTPLSRWGFERGTPVDRWYIERFLDEHRGQVGERVLEVLEDLYATRLGATVVDVLDIDATNPRATVIGDLCDPATLPACAFDAVVLTQTLQFVADPRRAVECAVAALRPGGRLLITVPTVSRVADPSDRWRWTPTGLEDLLADLGCAVSVRGAGNLPACRAFLMGLAVGDLPTDVLGANDPAFPLVVTAVVRKPGSAA